MALAQLEDDVAGGLPDELLSSTLRTVVSIDRQIRRAARTGEVLLVLKAACPACGRRDLVANCTSEDQERWSIRCRSPLCSCRGAGCSCGHPTPVEGRAHLWRAGDGSWHRLARQLGVSQTDLLGELLNRRPRRGFGSPGAGSGRAF
jgi:hypothetical protein